jgi:hypothetical protein
MVQTDQQYLFIHRTITALQRRLSAQSQPPSPVPCQAGLARSTSASAAGSPMSPPSPQSPTISVSSSFTLLSSELVTELAPMLAFAPCLSPGSPVSNAKRLKSSLRGSGGC